MRSRSLTTVGSEDRRLSPSTPDTAVWKALTALSISVTWAPHWLPALALRLARLERTPVSTVRTPALPASGGSSWSRPFMDALRAGASSQALEAATVVAAGGVAGGGAG